MLTSSVGLMIINIIIWCLMDSWWVILKWDRLAAFWFHDVRSPNSWHRHILSCNVTCAFAWPNEYIYILWNTSNRPSPNWSLDLLHTDGHGNAHDLATPKLSGSVGPSLLGWFPEENMALWHHGSGHPTTLEMLKMIYPLAIQQFAKQNILKLAVEIIGNLDHVEIDTVCFSSLAVVDYRKILSLQQ